MPGVARAGAGKRVEMTPEQAAVEIAAMRQRVAENQAYEAELAARTKALGETADDDYGGGAGSAGGAEEAPQYEMVNGSAVLSSNVRVATGGQAAYSPEKIQWEDDDDEDEGTTISFSHSRRQVTFADDT